MAKLETFVLLPDRVILSNKLRRVTPHARWMLVVMLTQWRRGTQHESKAFEYTYKELRQDTGYSFNRISKCMKELIKEKILEKQPGGLERNRNSFIVDYGWLRQRPYTKVAETSAPLNRTNGKAKSLMGRGKIVEKSPKGALSVTLDVEELLNYR